MVPSLIEEVEKVGERKTPELGLIAALELFQKKFQFLVFPVK